MTTTETPTPTKVYRTWFPAGANVPGITQRLRGKIYATDAGLYVYQDRRIMDQARPDFYSPINFEETPEPSTKYSAQQTGWVITTDAGRVLVRPLGACSCAFKHLKGWQPTWAVEETVWRG